MAVIYDASGQIIRSTKIPLFQKWSPVTINHDGSKLIINHGPSGHRLFTLWDLQQEKESGTVFRQTDANKLTNYVVSPANPKVFGIVETTDAGEFVGYQLRIWDLDTLSEKIVELASEQIASPLPLSVSADGKVIAVVTQQQGTETAVNTIGKGGESATLTLHDSNTGTIIKKIALPRGLSIPRFSPLTFSPDGRLIAGTTVGDKSIEIWDLDSGSLYAVIEDLADEQGFDKLAFYLRANDCCL
jgi:WD40 repeat protein